MPKPKRHDLKGPFNDEIRRVMDERGWTKLEQFADHFGIGRTTVYTLVLGRHTAQGEWIKPSLDTLIRLARALQRPVDHLLERLYPELDLPKPSAQLGAKDAVMVPVVGIVGAGPGQSVERETSAVFVPNRVARGKRLAAYQVQGDSMCAGKRPICDGDLVVVNRNDKGASEQVVVARLADGSYVCKALKDDRFGRRLMSLNPLYTNNAPPIIPAEHVDEIIGRVVWVQGAVDS
ncbi:LexA family transcriptional regulator [uncultured Meiothermus sp.]|jgi:repressor LexA|uniref:helix-turn-helix domain-containing protein n=1 Tax=uncultured Meiothermus sp. TaxID=157471 RepID=UPI00260CA9E5|nr:LexA family transcriptional regulator [uncultured Meiothermus sp.]